MTTSTVGWLDHSEADRRRMLAVIDLFRDQGTVDELGTSAIWDGFANLLFPGTGTVQTRARYFLIVPWVFKLLEGDRVPAAKASGALRRLEVRVIDSLIEGNSDDRGIIGRLARADLRRMPSAIYWSGLGRLGLREYSGSIDQLLRALSVSSAGRSAERDDDGELIESAAHRWHIDLPSSPLGFPAAPLDFTLLDYEADFLRERIRTAAPGTMLDILLEPDFEVTEVEFPWDHPSRAAFPTTLRLHLHHAQRFSEAIHGAALLYNLMLAEEKPVPELVEKYHERLSRWRRLMKQGAAHRKWQRNQLWALMETADTRVRPLARQFVEAWCSLVDEEQFEVEKNENARRLIRDRERLLKGGLARIGNRQALDRWEGGSGDGQYEFRWQSSQVVLRDIKRGLGARG